MARFFRSRYVNLDVLTDISDIKYLPLRKLLQVSDFVGHLTLSIGKNENLPMIAGLIWGLGNENLWWIIADYNSIRDPWTLEVGSTIHIPPLDKVLALLNDINLK